MKTKNKNDNLMKKKQTVGELGFQSHSKGILLSIKNWPFDYLKK